MKEDQTDQDSESGLANFGDVSFKQECSPFLILSAIFEE